MEIKEIYLEALAKNKGIANELELGENLGLNEEETREMIVQLLSENKIEYTQNKSCNYRLRKAARRKK